MLSDYESTRKAYYEYGFNFVSKLPGKLQLLDIDTNIFKLNIAHLYRFSSLKCLKFKHSLLVTESENGNENENDNDAGSLSVSDLRFEMDGRYSNNTILNIDQTLSVPPSLRSLYISNSNAILVGDQTIHVKSYSKLQILSINRSGTDSHLLRSIQRVAPNIKKLTWPLLEKYNAQNQDKTECDIDLSGYTLEKFNLSISKSEYLFDGTCSIDLHIRIQNQTKRLSFTENCSSVLVIQPYHLVDRNKELTSLDIICDNINQTKINNRLKIMKTENQIALLF